MYNNLGRRWVSLVKEEMARDLQARRTCCSISPVFFSSVIFIHIDYDEIMDDLF